MIPRQKTKSRKVKNRKVHITQRLQKLPFYCLFTGDLQPTARAHGTPGAIPDPLSLAPLRVKLAEVVLPEMLDIPRVLHGLPILSLQADRAGPGDAHHPKRSPA